MCWKKTTTFFLAGGDALVYLTKPVHKKHSQNCFGAIYLVRTYLMTNFSFPSSCAHLYTFLMTPPPFPQLCTYLMDGLFSTKKQITTFEYRIHWKTFEKHKLFKSNTCPKILHLISVTLSHINGIVIVHFKSYLSQCF